MEGRTKVVYSEAFKHLVCKEHIDTGASLNSLKRKYNISSHSLIHEWLRKYGYIEGKFKISSTKVILIDIPQKTQSEIFLPQKELNISNLSSEELQKELINLKKQLEEAQIKAEGYNLMIDYAEKEFKIPIRKKPNTK